jgi:hypothetical protein
LISASGGCEAWADTPVVAMINTTAARQAVRFRLESILFLSSRAGVVAGPWL